MLVSSQDWTVATLLDKIAKGKIRYNNTKVVYSDKITMMLKEHYFGIDQLVLFTFGGVDPVFVVLKGNSTINSILSLKDDSLFFANVWDSIAIHCVILRVENVDEVEQITGIFRNID